MFYIAELRSQKCSVAMKYGSTRIPADTQDYQAQINALKAAGCERIYSENVSGKSDDSRREFDELMRAVRPGDAVMVTKLDHLARSSRDLHNILEELQERGCGLSTVQTEREIQS
jgi:DNA invertase Pin-like site-specific DNA recombinase